MCEELERYSMEGTGSGPVSPPGRPYPSPTYFLIKDPSPKF